MPSPLPQQSASTVQPTVRPSFEPCFQRRAAAQDNRPVLCARVLYQCELAAKCIAACYIHKVANISIYEGCPHKASLQRERLIENAELLHRARMGSQSLCWSFSVKRETMFLLHWAGKLDCRMKHTPFGICCGLQVHCIIAPNQF